MSMHDKKTNDSIDATDLIDAPGFVDDGSSGRATWDERGNSIWEWQTAPGVYSREVSAQQLQALEAAGLEILEAPPTDDRYAVHYGRRKHKMAALRSKHSTLGAQPLGVAREPQGLFENFLKRLGLQY
jgi:hypothetical protein